ncbi:MAG TPA: hypothetical protein VFB36_01685 [Nevskiaceae bacterium]|nr:hypothetical protein [Nevskiaceae bacterium]
MKAAILTGALLVSGPAFTQDAQECRVLVGKEWIQMGTTTLAGCFRFADEAATPGERQFAKLGGMFLKVMGDQHFQSPDGGNTWEAVASTAPAEGFQSLNVLEPAQGEAAALASAPGATQKAPVKKKKKRRYRYN